MRCMQCMHLQFACRHDVSWSPGGIHISSRPDWHKAQAWLGTTLGQWKCAFASKHILCFWFWRLVWWWLLFSLWRRWWLRAPEHKHAARKTSIPFSRIFAFRSFDTKKLASLVYLRIRSLWTDQCESMCVSVLLWSLCVDLEVSVLALRHRWTGS